MIFKALVTVPLLALVLSNAKASVPSLDSVTTNPAAFDVVLRLENFNTHQENKVQKAAELIKRIIVTTEFKDGVLNHTYKGESIKKSNEKETFINVIIRFLCDSGSRTGYSTDRLSTQPGNLFGQCPYLQSGMDRKSVYAWW